MPQIDVVDATWVGAPPAALAAFLADPDNWRRWWPELDLGVDERRGAKGMRWTVRSGRGGTVAGSMEVWLQAADDGTVGHYFLRLDGTARALGRRERDRVVREYRIRAKQVFWELGALADPGRLARIGGPPSRIP